MDTRARLTVRKVCSFVVVAFMLTVIAGCGGGSDAPVDEAADNVTEDAAAPDGLTSADGPIPESLASAVEIDPIDSTFGTFGDDLVPSVANVVEATATQPSLNFTSKFEPEKQTGFVTRGWLDSHMTRGQSEIFLSLYGEPQQALTRTFISGGQASVQSMVAPDSPRAVTGGMGEFVSTFVLGATGTNFADALTSILPTDGFEPAPVALAAPGGDGQSSGGAQTHLRALAQPPGESFDIWVDALSRLTAIQTTSPGLAEEGLEPTIHIVTFSYGGSPFGLSSPAAGERTEASWSSNIAVAMEDRLADGRVGPVSFLSATCINMIAAGEPQDVALVDVVVELILLNCAPENSVRDLASDIRSSNSGLSGSAECMAQVLVDLAIGDGPIQSIWFMKDPWNPTAQVRPEIDRRLATDCGLTEEQWLDAGMAPALIDVAAFCQRIRDRYAINPHDPDLAVNTALWFAWDLEYQRRYYPPGELTEAHDVLVEAQERVVDFVAETGLTMANHADSPTVQAIYAEPDVQQAWRQWSRFFTDQCVNPTINNSELAAEEPSEEGAVEAAE